MRRRHTRGVIALAVVCCATATVVGGVSARGASPPGASSRFITSPAVTGYTDARVGHVAPSAVQLAEAAGAGLTVSWNSLGTPHQITRTDGFVATGLPKAPQAAAEAFIASHGDLLGLAPGAAQQLSLIMSAPIGKGRALLYQQTIDGVPLAPDGLLAIGVVDGKVAYVSSSLTRDATLSGSRSLSMVDAYRAAAAAAGLNVSSADVQIAGSAGKATRLKVAGIAQAQTVQLVGVPTATDGVRLAYQVQVYSNADPSAPVGQLSFVDASTGQVLYSESLVDNDNVDPDWAAFPSYPPLDYSSTDTRQKWCFLGLAAGCQVTIGNPASPLAWDIDPATGSPTHTTNGNNEIAVQNWDNNNPFSVGTETATPSPTRDYVYPWTNEWYVQRCNPDTTFSSPAANDIDAARANLFAMHNRMHDFSYNLGFTEQTFNLQRSNFGRGGAENDPEQGNAQAGGRSGGPASGFAARDNANQITPGDGTPPITNMYLWQPIAGAFYGPCVDGDFDMSVIGHEYTHAISNRMVGGPALGITGAQGGAMGESWSDLDVEEYLHENGYQPQAGEDPYVIGPYVTGDPVNGIRNYALDHNPLNYSDIGYDVTGPEVHADGEVWNGVNFAVRQALMDKYDKTFPSSNAALQKSCAEGQTPVDQCPGNRRWIQLVYDAWLLFPRAGSMVDARDAMLAADQMRFGGADLATLWAGFAQTGLGVGASSAGGNDGQPTPSFGSPMTSSPTITFAPETTDGTPITGAQIFVGDFEARATPIADTDPATPIGDSAPFVAGTYDVIVRAPGFGELKTTLTVRNNRPQTKTYDLRENLASSTNGATATGDGLNVPSLIDDTENTNWAFVGQPTATPVAGKQVTVHLDPSKSSWNIRRIQVSAMLRPQNTSDPGGDTGPQSRFSALRQFEIQTCLVKKSVDCSTDDQFSTIFTSPSDAFPSGLPRPRAPELTIRSFDVPKTKATFVRLVVLTNQCTGGPAYAGDQDDDPLNVTDCTTGSVQAFNVRAAELQVYDK